MQVSKKSHPKKLLLNCQLNISGQDPCSTAFFVNKHITTSYQLSASNSNNITMIFLSSSTCLHLIALVQYTLIVVEKHVYFTGVIRSDTRKRFHDIIYFRCNDDTTVELKKSTFASSTVLLVVTVVLHCSYDQSELDSRVRQRFFSYSLERNICFEFDRMRYLL